MQTFREFVDNKNPGNNYHNVKFGYDPKIGTFNNDQDRYHKAIESCKMDFEKAAILLNKINVSLDKHIDKLRAEPGTPPDHGDTELNLSHWLKEAFHKTQQVTAMLHDPKQNTIPDVVIRIQDLIDRVIKISNFEVAKSHGKLMKALDSLVMFFKSAKHAIETDIEFQHNGENKVNRIQPKPLKEPVAPPE